MSTLAKAIVGSTSYAPRHGAERAGTYEIAGAGAADHEPQTFKRDIPKDFYLRPIPQGQIDAMMMSDAEKEAYQNPGYRN